MKPLDITKINPKDLYKECTVNRASFLDRAREVSRYTKPSLYPREGADANTVHITPFSSLGARGLNNLANKIIMTIFPPNQSFFKARVPKKVLATMGKTEDEIKPAMAMVEQETIDEMEESGLRPKLIHAAELLIAGGSIILHVGPVEEPRVFRLDCFGIKRDARGNVLKMCIEEHLKYSMLSKQIQEKIPKEIKTEEVMDDKKSLKVYTCVIRHEDKMVVFQSVEQHIIKETRAEYLIDECPYQFIPFVDKSEDFGRSYIEDYMGDLISLEGLRQSTLEAAAEAARLIYVLAPNSTISVKDLKNARSGDVIVGNPADVQTIQQNKMADLSITNSEAERLRMDLSSIFLLDSSVRRNAERVTAMEISMVSQELEVAMGGVYSTLSRAQKTIVKLYMKRCMDKGSIPKELKSVLKAEIITGTAALGRGTEFNAMTSFLSTLQQQLGPEIYIQYVKPQAIISKLAYSAGINPTDIVKTDEELQMEQQQAQAAQQQQTMLEAEAPEAAKAEYSGE